VRRWSLVLAGLLLAVTAMSLAQGSWSHLADALTAFGSLRWQWAIAAVALEAAFVTLGGLVWVVALGAAGAESCRPQTMVGAQWLGRASSCVTIGPLSVATQASAALRDPAAADAGAGRVLGSLGAQRALENGVAGLIAAGVVVIAPGPLAPVRPLAVAFLALIPVVALVVRRVGTERARRIVPSRARRALRPIGQGARVFVVPRQLGRAAALQALAASCRIGALACLLTALGAPASAAPLAFCFILMAGALPALPGGAGTRELTLVPGLVAGFGLGTSKALAVSLGVQALVATAALLALPFALATLVRLRKPTLAAPAAAPASSAP
jgi:uncharacterized membrane protein YbhN (UPF0104 family)